MPFNLRNAFPAYRRLRTRPEFEQVFRSVKTSNAWFMVYARQNEIGFARVGIAASKRILPKAVSRNLAKRMIRETFRLEFPKEAGLDIVIYPRRKMTRENLAEGRNALRKLLVTVRS